MRRWTESGPAALWVLAVVLGACRPEEPAGKEATAPAALPAPAAAEDPAASFAAPIEEAHGLDAWRSQPAFAAHLTLYFGGNQALQGRMLFRTDLSASRLDLADGTVAVFDGERAWVYPASSGLGQARFHLLTWPYFLAAPMKLRDPGTHLEPLGPRELGGETYDAARLTFEPGVGDTPDDWYVLHRDRETGRLAAMVYIVTYGTSRSEAEAEPHAITYGDFVEVEGVAIPTRWQFWLWSEEQGIHGEPLGRAELADPEFVAPELTAFDRLEGAREDELPVAGR